MNHKDYEKKWQNYWEAQRSYYVDIKNADKKYFVQDMFPYPSGAGLHVGHTEGYTGSDIIARYKTMQGFNVLHPMGWDAFGLPAEQYAIKTGNNPRTFTNENIAIFKQQLKDVGFVYDWSKEVNTTDPNFYKWTQWIFLQLYKQGLAEEKNIEVNWCSELGTVLSNEDIINDNGRMVSEVGGFDVVKKPMKQWVLKITHYAEKLLDGLDDLDWPESIKEMQRNWIGKSEGATISFKSDKVSTPLNVFTTRPDTLFGATYFVIAPEHELVDVLTTEDYKESVQNYILDSKSKTDLERTELNKNKTGVFTGSYVINPVNQKQIPVWIADYVLVSYGTGMVMACPAHDVRDFEFATKYGLDIVEVLETSDSSCAFVGDAPHINSDFLNGLNIKDAKHKIIEWLEDNKCGSKEVNYKLRDWIFARQRYWGEPFPIIHWEDDQIELVENLPLELPILEEFKPTGTTESPLANATDWINVVRADGVKGRRESNTMPQWAGSCWYYIGYLLKQEDGTLIDLNSDEAKSILSNWLPVDFYIGGAEHAVLHLLYSRFWHKVLFDIGIVDTSEPFQRLFNQGMILGEDNVKMSKSRGNVVNPDSIVSEYGADTLRMYEMFMGPLDAMKPWSNDGVVGIRKYLDRASRMFDGTIDFVESDGLDFEYNSMVKSVINDYENVRFNTVISALMTFTNEVYKKKCISREHALGFLQCMYPIAPHICEELNEAHQLSNTDLTHSSFPSVDDKALEKSEMTIIVQVNGKLRGKVDVDISMEKDMILKAAKELDSVVPFIAELTIVKEIYVPNKLVNLVVK